MLLRSLIAMLMVTGLFQADSFAQRHRPLHQLRPLQMRPVQTFNRSLGLWSGAGYHHQNPGPNTGYYNPYTAHNSGLVTRGYIPQDMGMMFSPVAPVYGQPAHVQPQTVLKADEEVDPPAPLGGSYEPFDAEDDTDDMPEQEDSQLDPFDEDEDLDSLDLEEKDGFDFDEENDLRENDLRENDLLNEPVEKTPVEKKSSEKMTWEEYEKQKAMQSENDFELPSDALNYGG